MLALVLLLIADLDLREPLLRLPQQLPRRNRLEKHGHAPRLSASRHDRRLIASRERNDHTRRDTACSHFSEYVKAVDVGKAKVEQKEIDWIRLDDVKNLRNVARSADTMPGLAEQDTHRIAHQLIVLGHEHMWELRHSASARGVGNRKKEATAGTERALEPDAPAVQLDEPARDRQAQASAVVLTRCTRVHLCKLLEHEIVVLCVDPDSGVANFDHALRAIRSFDTSCVHPDMTALRRKVDRITEQVPHDVGDLLPISRDGIELGGNDHHEVHAFLARERFVERTELRHHLAQMKRR